MMKHWYIERCTSKTNDSNCFHLWVHLRFTYILSTSLFVEFDVKVESILTFKVKVIECLEYWETLVAMKIHDFLDEIHFQEYSCCCNRSYFLHLLCLPQWSHVAMSQCPTLCWPRIRGHCVNMSGPSKLCWATWYMAPTALSVKLGKLS